MEKPSSFPPPVPGGRLESWKEIGSYLHRDVRTVQRWERTKGLPVRRLPGGDMARVYALRSELDAWWNSRGIHLLAESEAPPAPGRRNRSKVWLAAAAAVAVTVLLAVARLLPRLAVPAPRVAPFTSYVGEVGYPSFSPDGRQVVFTWNGEKQDNYDLYIKLIGGGDPLRLTRHPAYDTMAAWSPDGRQIVFMRWFVGMPDAQIVVVPALGGAERLIGTVLVPEVWPAPAFSWSRDCRWLLVGYPESVTRTALSRMAADTGERERLSTPPQGWWGDDSPVLSPDGSKVAFVRRRGPQEGNVYLLSLTPDYRAAGEPRQITHEACCVSNPLWTAGGREILYLKRDTDITAMYQIAPVAGAEPREVTTIGTLGTQFAIAPRGDRLLYVSGAADSDLWRVNLPPGAGHDRVLNPIRVLSSSRVDAMPDFSPDGKRVAFCSNRSGSMEIWVADSDGANSRQLTSLDGPQALLPRWSPDGTRIAFHANMVRNRDVYVISAEGGEPRPMTSGGTNYAASWSHDGNWLYFASDRTGAFECWKTPSRGGSAVQITRQGGYGGLESSDGKWLYYAKTYAPGAVWRVPVEGGREQPVHPAVQAFRVPWNFAVTARGIYTSATENPLSGFRLQLFHPESGTVEVLGRISKSVGRSMTVSPDGRSFLFQDFPAGHGDVMLVENFRVNR